MEAMDKPNLDLSRDQASANLWREGALLLGDLKATQSLDFLLSHIRMTDGEFSMTMTHQPALEGIVRMGSVAIPKLKRLLRNQDWQSRHYAVYCLARIGGTQARSALQQAVVIESDSCVKHFMVVSIRMINAVKQNQGDLVRAFLCTSVAG
jgi:HEAT repeat protein